MGFARLEKARLQVLPGAPDLPDSRDYVWVNNEAVEWMEQQGTLTFLHLRSGGEPLRIQGGLAPTAHELGIVQTG
jgi:hypothetical protein